MTLGLTCWNGVSERKKREETRLRGWAVILKIAKMRRWCRNSGAGRDLTQFRLENTNINRKTVTWHKRETGARRLSEITTLTSNSWVIWEAQDSGEWTNQNDLLSNNGGREGQEKDTNRSRRGERGTWWESMHWPWLTLKCKTTDAWGWCSDEKTVSRCCAKVAIVQMLTIGWQAVDWTNSFRSVRGFELFGWPFKRLFFFPHRLLYSCWKPDNDVWHVCVNNPHPFLFKKLLAVFLTTSFIYIASDDCQSAMKEEKLISLTLFALFLFSMMKWID